MGIRPKKAQTFFAFPAFFSCILAGGCYVESIETDGQGIETMTIHKIEACMPVFDSKEDYFRIHFSVEIFLDVYCLEDVMKKARAYLNLNGLRKAKITRIHNPK